MSVLQITPNTAADVPAWMGEAAFWLAVASLLAALAAAAGIWTLVARLREVRTEGGRLAKLDELDQKLGKLTADRDDLDLRRIEHVLIDLRDTQKRLEDVFLRVLEAGRGTEGTSRELVPSGGSDSLADRVTNRLIAMGYERIQIITRADKLTEIATRDGEVLVEARREGVLHKGRVLLRNGRLAEVELHPAYSIFP